MINKKKGEESLLIIFLVFVILAGICFLLDSLNINKRKAVATTTLNYISKTVSNQGGIRVSIPNNFAGGKSEYITSAQLYSDIEEIMAAKGVPTQDWEVKINNITLTKSTNVPLINYGSEINVQLDIKYTWQIISLLIPIEDSNEYHLERAPKSSYKIREKSYSTSYD